MGRIIRNDLKRPLLEDRQRALIQNKPTRHQMTSSGTPIVGPPKTPVPPSNRRRLQTLNPVRHHILPPEDLPAAWHVLFTGGIGDFIVLESYMSFERREQVQEITLATRAHAGIKGLLECHKTFPNVQNVNVVDTDWEKKFCYIVKDEIIDSNINLENTQDWSIFVKFPYIERGILSYKQSSFVSNQIAEFSRFNLPREYAVCNPYSPNDRREGRDFTEQDWHYLQSQSKQMGLPIVVVNVSDDYIPSSPSIINLNRQTSLPESIEVVKGAKQYIGIDSCLSIIAAQTLPAEKLRIKSNNGHLYNHKRIYYAPHTQFPFIVETF